MTDLAMSEFKAGNINKSIAALKNESNKGNVDASFTLARIYYHGLGMEVDRNAAEHILRKLRQPEARMLLADLLCTEAGTTGYVEACSIYSELAAAGDMVAMYKLALVHQTLGRLDLASSGLMTVIYSDVSTEKLKVKAQRSLNELGAENAS